MEVWKILVVKLVLVGMAGGLVAGMQHGQQGEGGGLQSRDVDEILFICSHFSRPDDKIYVADKTNCQRFYMCNWGYAWSFDCPQQTFWDTLQDRCEWTHSATNNQCGHSGTRPNIRPDGGPNTHVRNTHARNTHARNTHTGDTHARHTHTGDTHTRNTHTGGTHTRNTHARDTHARNTHTGDTHAHNTHTGDTHARNTHTGDTHARKTHTGDTHTGDTHTGDTHTGETHYNARTDKPPMPVIHPNRDTKSTDRSGKPHTGHISRSTVILKQREDDAGGKYGTNRDRSQLGRERMTGRGERVHSMRLPLQNRLFGGRHVLKPPGGRIGPESGLRKDEDDRAGGIGLHYRQEMTGGGRIRLGGRRVMEGSGHSGGGLRGTWMNDR